MEFRENSDQQEKAHRVPSAWLCLPLVLGIWLGFGNLSLSPTLLWACGLFSLAGATWLAWKRSPFRPWVWAFVFSAGMIALFTLYTQGHRHPLETNPHPWDRLPPREVTALLTLEKQIGDPADTSLALGLAWLTPKPGEPARFPESRVLVQAFPSEQHPWIRGSRLEVTGILIPLHNPDYLEYSQLSPSFLNFLRQKGCQFYLDRAWIIKETHPPSLFQQAFHQQNQRAKMILETTPWGPRPNQLQVQIFKAMMLGEAGNIQDQYADMFRRSGTMHLFAISGLHIGIIALWLHLFMRLMPLPFSAKSLLLLILLGSFIGATGFSQSALRAFTMIFLYILARWLQRKPQGLSILIASAFIHLLINPRLLFDTGFQLSYVVVLAILLIGIPLAQRWRRALSPPAHIPGQPPDIVTRSVYRGKLGIVESAAISFAAFVGSQPITASTFGLVSPFSFLLNIPLVFLAMVIIGSGAVSLAFGFIGLAPLVPLLNTVALTNIQMMVMLTETVYRLPGSWIPTPGIPFPAWLALGLGIGAFLFLPRSKSPPNLAPWLQELFLPFGVAVFLFNVFIHSL